MKAGLEFILSVVVTGSHNTEMSSKTDGADQSFCSTDLDVGQTIDVEDEESLPHPGSHQNTTILPAASRCRSDHFTIKPLKLQDVCVF